jgi:hypothetical protein
MARRGCIILRASLYCIVIIAAIILIGCSLYESKPALEEPVPIDSGTLVLTLSLGTLSSKTLVPPISMEIASFDIEGTGPLGDSFSALGNTAGQLTLNGLTPGFWTITVAAKNSGGTIVGYGEAVNVDLLAGQVNNIQITIAPSSGTGTLTLVVQWQQNTHKVKDVTIQRSLISMSSGEDLAPAFEIVQGKPDTATYSNTAIPTGYYLLTLRLYDTDVLFWGITEAVRIVAGQTTTQTWTTN